MTILDKLLEIDDSILSNQDKLNFLSNITNNYTHISDISLGIQHCFRESTATFLIARFKYLEGVNLLKEHEAEILLSFLITECNEDFKLSTVILRFFNWFYSEQGFDYWRELCNRLIANNL